MTNEEIIEKIRTTLAEEFEVDIGRYGGTGRKELRFQRNRTRFCGYQNLPGLLRSRYHPYAGSQVNMSTWKGKTRGGRR